MGSRELTKSEVDGLAQAEAVAEACVIGAREGDHDLAGPLDQPAHLHACGGSACDQGFTAGSTVDLCIERRPVVLCGYQPVAL